MTTSQQQLQQCPNLDDNDLEHCDETNKLLQSQPASAKPHNPQENPIKMFQGHPLKQDQDPLMKRMSNISGRKSHRCCLSSSLFIKLFTEQFNATVLVLPGLYYQIGYFSATIQLTVFSLVAAFSAKLVVESSRLQTSNYHMHNREDFESLVCSNRFTNSFVIGVTQSAYIVLLVTGTVVSIILSSSVLDEAINLAVDGSAGNGNKKQYFVSLMRASDKELNPIPDSELIQISRGYAFFLVFALVYSAIIGPRKLNHGYTLKFFAVFFLIVGAALDVPKTVWNGLASSNFSAFEYPEGQEPAFIRTLYYSGFIAFTVGNLPIQAPEIASQHKTSELPYYSSALAALLTKIAFGLFGSQIIMKTDQQMLYSYALIGAVVYCTLFMLPEIIQTQARMYVVLFCRSTWDLSLSISLTAILPWILSALVHRYDTVFSTVCLLGSTLSMFVCFITPFMLYACSLDEASKYESNFKLSVKQMYAGDKLSRKETYIIPKTSKEIGDSIISQSDYPQTTVSTNISGLVAITSQTSKTKNTLISIRCKQYPTTQFLRASEMQRHRSDCGQDSESICWDESSEENIRNCDSEFSEAFSIKTDEELDTPLDTQVLIKTFNQQGNYATRQSLTKVLCNSGLGFLSPVQAVTVFQAAATLIFLVSAFMYLSWILINQKQTQVSLFEFEAIQRDGMSATGLVQTAVRIFLRFLQLCK